MGMIITPTRTQPTTSLYDLPSRTTTPRRVVLHILLPAATHLDPSIIIIDIAPAQPIARDLSNLKFAQNQTELSRQIAELAEEARRQGVLMGRLVEVLGEGGIREGALRDVLKGRGKRREGWHGDEDER
ncbi:hypothetical protein D9611_014458 [Ephemerocybe angulata]|uniref:Uncharacterized protein n=1 Tax=Ephemerocybe angulata TaxID=980116 RepID=A0A8H5ARU2_9AGAR|nr:hypothetical protein D9611_014458 [Tulosesus angulatus]